MLSFIETLYFLEYQLAIYKVNFMISQITIIKIMVQIISMNVFFLNMCALPQNLVNIE